jgi:cobalt-zinc-cadmium efflux system membrane fusion protein
MKTFETEAAQFNEPADAVTNGPPSHAQPDRPSPQRPKGSLAKILLFMLLACGAAGGAYAYMIGLQRVRQDADRALSYLRLYVPATAATTSESNSAEAAPTTPWDGFVRVKMTEATTIGLLVVTVQPQVESIKLPLMGRTDYDPNTLSKIRPRFDTLVEKVRAELGQKVKKGDPLVDLFSTELAAAKNDFQTAYVQWQHDVNLLNLREELFRSPEKAISKQLLVDTQNDEKKSRLTYTTAREKLIVFGVPEEQIDPLLKNLGEKPIPQAMHAISEKARMTRLSPVDGIVIQRDAVPGNLYDNNDVLMIIAPLDHLFVWVNVYEADQAKVAVGQEMEIRFPYLDKTIPGQVQYFASEVSKDTRAIKLRTSIPNVDGKLKADMLVRAIVNIPPVAGQTVIPRSAMVVMNGNEYAFVQREGDDTNGVEQFERRQLVVAEERDEHVVVKSGLKPGEHVAANGSLVLAQLYEDQQMVATGMPLK